MPRHKDLKRLIRARMEKTGEAYTAARAQVIQKQGTAPATDTAASPPVAAPPDLASLAGMSDERIKESTGCTWERWVYALDRRKAYTMSHKDIATLLREKYKVDSWWSQTVTVGYERIKGLRARGQKRSGSYEVSRSRTFNVPVTTLFDAWANARTRTRWLDGARTKVRTATAPKSLRLDWADNAIVAVGFIAKGTSRSTVAFTHTKLQSREAADAAKAYWAERLDALGEVLNR
ncbi:MAG: hypothetical protein ABI625_11735 [bacterium]